MSYGYDVQQDERGAVIILYRTEYPSAGGIRVGLRRFSEHFLVKGTL